MIETLIDRMGEPALLALAGLLVGLIFGASAQHSRFCLRAATIEIAEGRPGERMAVWLVVFFTALTGVQLAIVAGVLDVSAARQIAATGSLSGAILGGLMFGVGMILARGCASRLLVLSGTGNLRALITGLVVTLVAQSSYRGVLAPLREWMAGLWTVGGGPARDLGLWAGLTPLGVAGLAGAGILGGLALGRARHLTRGAAVAALIVGLSVALGWGLTYAVAASSFEVIAISSVTFTGPSTDTLMALVTERSVVLSFGIGLVPGVFAGSAAMAWATGTWRLERFGHDTPMERYLIGAVLMGFGAMLAGGCAVGAGISGGAVLSLTAWVAVGSMWAGSFLMQALMHLGARRGAGRAAA